MTEPFPKSREEARQHFMRPKPDLVINKVPQPTLEGFKKLAGIEFGGDYGMTLKFLLDGYGDNKFNFIFDTLQSHEDRLTKLEGGSTARKIRLLGGGVIEVKRE